MALQKFFATSMAFLLISFGVTAQRETFEKEWNKVESLEKKGLSKSAAAEVGKILNRAMATGNEAQQIKAALYTTRYRVELEEDGIPSNIKYIDSLTKETKPPVKNIFQSVQAELLLNYRRANRYKLYQRTELKEENSDDIETWSLEKLNRTISSLYAASLKNSNTLQNTPIGKFDPILEKGKNTRHLRPTLYDFLVYRALEYFADSENDISHPSYKFILNDKAIFAPAGIFAYQAFHSRDTTSLYLQALRLYQGLLIFHQNDKEPDAFLDADLARLQFGYRFGVMKNIDSLYERALFDLENIFPKNSFISQAKYLRAQLYYSLGKNFDPVFNKDKQFYIKKSKDLCDSTIQFFPGSEGAIQCKLLLVQINMPELKLETGKINIPGKPIKSLVSYRNIPAIYFRIIKTSREVFENTKKNNYEIDWKALTELSPLQSWRVNLPGNEDLQPHSAEIKIDALPKGTYLLLASTNAEFKMDQNILAAQLLYSSHISFINDQNEYFVLDRESGGPLENASVQVWEKVYAPEDRKYISRKSDKYITDAHGYFKRKQSKENRSFSLEIKYKQDELFSDDEPWEYYYNSYESNEERKIFLFTDRSIYRPGQIVYFKGIAIKTDPKSHKSSLVINNKSSIILEDANREAAGKLYVQSGEYGSFSGNFKLPEGRLNGQYSIRDSATQSSVYFNVEEYKRPKFRVDIVIPHGLYKVNDTVHVKGTAIAYAGNNINDAKVTYRVVRKVNFPIWYGGGYGKIWPPHGRGGDMEITNGITHTDPSGNFSISFNAIPDETVNRKLRPVFSYEVIADVTDLNGETRSNTTSIQVAYHSLELKIIAPDKINIDSLSLIKINSNNINGVFEKASVEFSLIKLHSPEKMYRKRYWKAPDQFIISKEDHEKYFPDDPYKEEDQVINWQEEKTVIKVTDTTSANGHFTIPTIPGNALQPGWYKVIVKAIDKSGEEIEATQFIRFTRKVDDHSKFESFVLNVDDLQLSPGEKLNYSVATGFESIYLIKILLNNAGKETGYQALKRNSPVSDTKLITEEDRGGIILNYAFVKNNRVYTQNIMVRVPWDNKKLNITYETFRDKILPGSEEQWKVKISGSKGEKVAAEMLVNMYDASLDQFKDHNWNSIQVLWPEIINIIQFGQKSFTSIQSIEYDGHRTPEIKLKPKSYDQLLDVGWNRTAGDYDYYRSRGFKGKVEVQFAEANGNILTTDATSYSWTSADTIKSPTQNQPTTPQDNIQVRKNFNETAFFFPSLFTDKDGSVTFSFTTPDALTQWKLMSLVHSKDLASGYEERLIKTQKSLMAQVNPPRFFREGDRLELPVKITSLGDSELTGSVQLELFDAATNQSVDGWFKNIFPVQYFTANPGQSVVINYTMEIPFSFNGVLGYRVKAISKDQAFSDGEESAIPVLTNRMLVTESQAINMRHTTKKDFRFDKLINSNNSPTLSHHSLSVEYTSNPAWYAIQALPYLAEFPHECAEQTFNRYYANKLAGMILQSTPKIKAVFDQWRIKDTAALLSNLLKNEELKSALIQETPWVLEAQNENEQKRQLALLFDMAKMGDLELNALNKLSDMQLSNGGFPWFKGGPDDRFITDYILTGIGHLRKLGLDKVNNDKLGSIVKSAIFYADQRIRDEYNFVLRSKEKIENNHLTPFAIHYLYMRSFFPDQKISPVADDAYNYYLKQGAKYWLSQGKNLQAMLAMVLSRPKASLKASNLFSKKETTSLSSGILASLKESAINNNELGMYWKDLAKGGYYWHQAPIENQSVMIEAFSELEADQILVDDLRTWLLKQKQTRHWSSTKATADACYALLMKGNNWLTEEKTITIQLGNTTISSREESTEAGTGYFKKSFAGDRVKQEMGNIQVSITDTIKSSSTSWGAVYWQYFEDLDKITSATTPLTLKKQLYIQRNTDKGPVLELLKDGEELHVGDKIKVRIELKSDRDMEYLHMKDMRASCMEPVSVLSEYKFQGGLGYYESTKDASTNLFFHFLPRGTYIFEYPLFVTHYGNFSNGITSIQSMYAPEFTSHTEGIRVNVIP